MVQQSIFAQTALLPDGWAKRVHVEIGGGRIVRVEADLAPDRQSAAMPAVALLPAPTNLHSHTFQRMMTGRTQRPASDASSEPRDSFWTWRDLMYRALAVLDPDDVEAIAAMAFVEMLEAGYGAVGEFHYLHHGPGGRSYADHAETSARIMAAADLTGIGLTHLPVLYMQGGADGRPVSGGQARFSCSERSFRDLLTKAAAAIKSLPPDARLGVAPHSLRAVPAEVLRRLGNDHGDDPIHIHAAEQVREVEEIEATLGARPIDWLLAETGLGPNWCVVHATHMTECETRGLARSGAVAGLCPITEADLGDGIFNGAGFLMSGGRFGVGTDSNVAISLTDEVRQLEYSQRLKERARVVLAVPGRSNGRLLYDAVCVGGAQAIGRSSGAIEPGNWADLVALDLNAQALYGMSGDEILDAWIFSPTGCRNAVLDVWSAGRNMVTDGCHHHRSAIEARYRACLDKVMAAA